MRTRIRGGMRDVGGTLAVGLGCVLVSLGSPNDARAQIPLDVVARRHPGFAERMLAPRSNAGKPARLIVPWTRATGTTPPLRSTDAFAVVSLHHRDDYRGLTWSPPKRLLLDQVHEWVDSEGYRQLLREEMPELTDRGLGKGVTIGIVDGGIDLRHADLRNSDGTTRASWLLDFGSGALGYHPELEEEFGCTNRETPCAILSAKEIDEALSNAESNSVVLPEDRLGHGTHVASIAAGGGQANTAYRGVAPEATLIVALLAGDGVEVQDADVLLASKFVFERAAEAGQPAVVNLSLGGDFGPHDGSTLLERALVSLLDRPGRAMVVAAGNSGGTFSDGPENLTGPFGIHRDVRVDGQSLVELAIPAEQASFEGDVLIWVDTKPGEKISVGVDSERGAVLDPVTPGTSGDASTSSWKALVSNRAALDDPSLSDLEDGTLVLLSGHFRRNEVIRLRLVGDAHAALWVQGTGELSMTASTRGPLFAMARTGGTITVPAAAPELIAVGATLNRTAWTSRDGRQSELAMFTDQLDVTPGSVGFFSSVGPNQSGNSKPNILAPGAAIVAAMAPSADPMPPGAGRNLISMFGESAMCNEDPLCTVVDDSYAVAIGTSMAAPVVSGAVALLLERDPTLTQSQIMQLLQAGVSRQKASKTSPAWERSLPAAPGLLNLPRTHRAFELLESQTRAEPSKDQTWLTFADSYVSPGQTVEVHLWTRTADGDPALLDSSDLDVRVTNGKSSQKLTRQTPGLFRLVVKADADKPLTGSDALEVRVRYDGATLAKASLPIAGDLGDVRGFGRPTPRLRDESCGLASPHDSSRNWASLFVLASVVLLRRRRGHGGTAATRGPQRNHTSRDK